MATIKPFRALRPPVELAHKVAALPYDVMNETEARDMAYGNSHSFLHISRPEIDLPSSIDCHTQEVYRQGQLNLAQFMQNGTLTMEDKDCYYVYRQKMGKIIQTGLVVCASVDDYQSGAIKKHELTRADKEEDRVNHIDYLDANDEPVFYLSRSNSQVEAILADVTQKTAEYDFTTEDGVSHTLWIIRDDSIIERLTELFVTIPRLYVADGHHRSAAAGRVRELRRKQNLNHSGAEEYNYFLTVIFPENQLHIMPYNRAVKDLNGATKEQFMAKISELFTVVIADESVAPDKRHNFGMYMAGQWYELTSKDFLVNENDTVGRLDVSILQNNVLAPLLGIENPRTDQRIHFVGGIRGNDELVKLVDSGEYAVAFSLHPTSITELIDLADQDKIMPPKSTWFEPKLRSGLFVHLLK